MKLFNRFSKISVICFIILIVLIAAVFALNRYCLDITRGTYNAIELLFI